MFTIDFHVFAFHWPFSLFQFYGPYQFYLGLLLHHRKHLWPFEWMICMVEQHSWSKVIAAELLVILGCRRLVPAAFGPGLLLTTSSYSLYLGDTKLHFVYFSLYLKPSPHLFSLHIPKFGLWGCSDWAFACPIIHFVHIYHPLTVFF